MDMTYAFVFISVAKQKTLSTRRALFQLEEVGLAVPITGFNQDLALLVRTPSNIALGEFLMTTAEKNISGVADTVTMVGLSMIEPIWPLQSETMPGELDYVYALIEITAEKGRIPEVFNALQDISDIGLSLIVSGPADIVVLARSTIESNFAELLVEVIESISGVTKTHTHTFIGQFFDPVDWPLATCSLSR